MGNKKKSSSAISEKDKQVLESFINSLIKLNKEVASDVKIEYSFFNIKNKKLNREWEEFKKDWKMNVTDVDLNIIKKNLSQGLPDYQKINSLLTMITDYPYVRKTYINKSDRIKKLITPFLRKDAENQVKKDEVRLKIEIRGVADILWERGIPYGQRMGPWLYALLNNNNKRDPEVISKKFVEDYYSKLGLIVFKRVSTMSELINKRLESYEKKELENFFTKDDLKRRTGMSETDTMDILKISLQQKFINAIVGQCYENKKISKYNSFRYAWDGGKGDWDAIFDVAEVFLLVNSGKLLNEQKPKS